MKMYFAGPLFTPYVRAFIAQHAAILRQHGIDPFVPHQSMQLNLSPELMSRLVQDGLIDGDDVGTEAATEAVRELVHAGRLQPEEVGLPRRSAEGIFDVDYAGLAASNAVLALLDGSQVDDGTACEIGIFYGLSRTDPTKKGVIGLMTDSRSIRKADHGYGVNFFVLGVIEEIGKVVHSFDEVLTQLKAWDEELTAGNTANARALMSEQVS